jgi:hypothetical protein
MPRQLPRSRPQRPRVPQALNTVKLELNSLMAEQQRLEKEKRERLAQRASFQADFESATAERVQMEALARRLKLEQQDSDQPKILDYIRLKHENMVRTPAGVGKLVWRVPLQ